MPDNIPSQAQVGPLDPVTQAVLRDKLTYLAPKKLERLERALKESAAIDGDLLEFGVALGGSGIILAHHIGASRRFLGFDVFGMIPEPTSDKDDDKSRNRYAVIRSGKSIGIGGELYYGYRPDLYTEVSASFARHGVPVDGSRVILHRGLFEQTWPSAGVESIAVVHIDCDWYDPVGFCLRACADKLSEGGVMIIDDYHDFGGCRAAVDEFLAGREDFCMESGPNPLLRKIAAAAPIK